MCAKVQDSDGPGLPLSSCEPVQHQERGAEEGVSYEEAGQNPEELGRKHRKMERREAGTDAHFKEGKAGSRNECSAGMYASQKRASDPAIDDCGPPCGRRELNSAPLKEQSVLLTAEPLSPAP
ncbi:hypothetical protein STEG23_003671 [Scotinomys teguina]